MEFIADALLIAGAAAAAFYCIVLSRRLKRFNDLEKGIGGAIAVFSSQVDDMTKTLERAESAAKGSNDSLEALTQRAEDVSRRLELLVASMHDLPEITESENTPANSQKTDPRNSDNVVTSMFRSARENRA